MKRNDEITTFLDNSEENFLPQFYLHRKKHFETCNLKNLSDPKGQFCWKCDYTPSLLLSTSFAIGRGNKDCYTRYMVQYYTVLTLGASPYNLPPWIWYQQWDL
ncbi:hypothetical protein FQA39_LY03901 [Lamprigera yunnana]|nr:hypothetical protein FQA39_LY03901 [Lamprigera yunnana]